MCLASTYKKETGVLLIYTSEDGKEWTYLNRLQDKQLGTILECPDVFEIDGRHVLISSPLGLLSGTDYPGNQSTMQLLSFDAENGSMRLEGKQSFLDYGMDLYAPQSCLDEKGRRCVIAWVRMPVPQPAEDNEAADGRPWSGMMCLPRVVTLRNGHIYTSVHPKVREYFAGSSVVKMPEGYAECTRDGRSRVTARIHEGKEIELAGVYIELRDGRVCTYRGKRVPKGVAMHTKCRTPYVGDKCELEIFIEKNLIEIFVNDGQYVITNVLYTDARTNA